MIFFGCVTHLQRQRTLPFYFSEHTHTTPLIGPAFIVELENIKNGKKNQLKIDKLNNNVYLNILDSNNSGVNISITKSGTERDLWCDYFNAKVLILFVCGCNRCFFLI